MMTRLNWKNGAFEIEINDQGIDPTPQHKRDRAFIGIDNVKIKIYTA